MEIEYLVEEQKKEIQAKLDATQKSYKVLELKSKTYQDQSESLSWWSQQVRVEMAVWSSRCHV